MEHPVQVAFCPLLFTHSGGEFSEFGKPVFVGEDIRGLCDKAYNCNDCFIMQNWLARLRAEKWVHGWECLKCLSDTLDTPRNIPGFYQEGRLEADDSETEKPSVPGCTRCGWQSSFLQLVLRRTQ